MRMLVVAGEPASRRALRDLVERQRHVAGRLIGFPSRDSDGLLLGIDVVIVDLIPRKPLGGSVLARYLKECQVPPRTARHDVGPPPTDELAAKRYVGPPPTDELAAKRFKLREFLATPFCDADFLEAREHVAPGIGG